MTYLKHLATLIENGYLPPEVNPSDPFLLSADCHDEYLPKTAGCFYYQFNPDRHQANKSGVIPPHLKLYRTANNGSEEHRRKQLVQLLSKRHDIRFSPVNSTIVDSGFVSMAIGDEYRLPNRISPATGAICKTMVNQTVKQSD